MIPTQLRQKKGLVKSQTIRLIIIEVRLHIFERLTCVEEDQILKVALTFVQAETATRGPVNKLIVCMGWFLRIFCLFSATQP